MHHKHNGFHLIEVVISVALIAILVQLASPRYNHTRVKINKLNMLAKLNDIQFTLNQCYAKYGSYIACKQNGVEVSTDGYLITALGADSELDCYRWTLNDQQGYMFITSWGRK